MREALRTLGYADSHRGFVNPLESTRGVLKRAKGRAGYHDDVVYVQLSKQLYTSSIVYSNMDHTIGNVLNTPKTPHPCHTTREIHQQQP